MLCSRWCFCASARHIQCRHICLARSDRPRALCSHVTRFAGHALSCVCPLWHVGQLIGRLFSPSNIILFVSVSFYNVVLFVAEI